MIYTKISKNKKAFTLVELLVVVAIIGLMAAIATVALNSARAKARDATRTQTLKSLQNVLELYYLDNGQYPIQTSAPGVCIDPSYGDALSVLAPTYMDALPTDPKSPDYCYIYKSDGSGRNYRLAAYMENLTDLVMNDGYLRWDWYQLYTDPPSVIFSTGGGCFLAGTKILMADKSFKNIEKIQVGEYVLSFDENKQKIKASKVAKALIHTKENTVKWENGYFILQTANKQIMKVTGNHPIYARKNEKFGYFRADTLKKGDAVLNLVDNIVIWVNINQIIFREQKLETVYNLELEGSLHNYFSEGILVHNAK